MQAATTSDSVALSKFRGDYWQQSRRPLTSLAFVTPLLVVYEAGVLWLGPQAMRNGADVWLRQLLDLLGFSQYFLLPVLTLGLLAAWHHLTQERWRLPIAILYAKLAECVLLAVALVVIARLQANLQSLFTCQPPPAMLHASVGLQIETVCKRFVSFMGAGIYEEMLFRLMLLPLLAWGLRCAWLQTGLVVGRLRDCDQFDLRRRPSRWPIGRAIPVVRIRVPQCCRRVLCDAVHFSRLRHRRRHPRGVRHSGWVDLNRRVAE